MLAGVAQAKAPDRPDPLVLQDVEVIADHRLVPGAPGAIAVTVRAAHNWTHRRPLAGAWVVATLIDAEEGEHPLGQAVSDATGAAPLVFTTPPHAPGRGQIHVRVRSRLGASEHALAVETERAAWLHLRTDRTIYRPGETLNWRITRLAEIDAHPQTGPIQVVVKDPRGTQIWRGTAEPDATGMVAGRLPLSADALLGRWAIEARVDGQTTKRTIELRPAKRPAFFVELEKTDAGVTVEARHPTGEPVRGRVEITAIQGDAAGALDADGRLEAPLADGEGMVQVVVEDEVGRKEQAQIYRPSIEPGPAELAVVPERTPLVPGVPQFITVVATDGRGELLPAVPSLSVDGAPSRRVWSAPGVARYRVVPGDGAIGVTAHVEHGDGGAGMGRQLSVGRAEAGIVRIEQPVIEPSTLVRVSGRWADTDAVELTLLRREVPLVTRRVPVHGGRFKATLTPPEGVFGVVRVRATRVSFDPDAGELSQAEAAAVAYLRPTPLNVELSSADRYRPGAQVDLGVKVTDRRGRPVEGAGLSAEAIDRRVLKLGDPGVDLARAIQAVDTDATVAGAAFSALLAARDTPAVRLSRSAALHALPTEGAAPAVVDDAVDRWAAEKDRLGAASASLEEGLVTWPGALVRRAGKRWRWAMTLDAMMAASAWPADARLTPWQRPTTWIDLVRFDDSYDQARMLDDAVHSRLDAIVELIDANFVASKAALMARTPLHRVVTLAAHLRVDPWGHRIRVLWRKDGRRVAVDLVAPGPDGRVGTADDARVDDLFPVRISLGRKSTRKPRVVMGHGVGAGGSGVGFGGVGTIGRGGAAAAVRRNFDETALWRVGLRTDAAGEARIPFTMPDSLTAWRVRVEALSANGAVGAAERTVHTTLPMSVDAELPERLVVGDRFTVPVLVHNRTDGPRTVEVLTRLGGAVAASDHVARIELPGGGLRSVPVELHASAAGEAEVRLDLVELTADGPVALDAVERRFPVEPTGMKRQAVVAAMPTRAQPVRFTVPESAPDTWAGVVRAFRGPQDTVVDGLEALIRAPYGCFEQTSSTTYPNLLVMGLIDDDDPARAELRQRAEDFVARGYQRLVSYEVEGGGFSWFGEAPANQVLTAYGLLEFVDMARVYPIDPALIGRTARWLVGQQQDDGRWQPDPSWLHDWSAVQGDIATTAYIAWALAEAGAEAGEPAVQALQKARGYLRRHAAELEKQPYLMVLWALAEEAPRQATLARALEARLTKGDAGWVLPAGQTLFAGSGQQADVQTTALVATLLARAGAQAPAQQTRRWLWQARSARGGWGTTQGTVLALRTAVESKPAPVSGQIAVRLDGQRIGAVDLDAAGIPTVELPTLAPGTYTLGLDSDTPLQVDLRQRWWTPTGAVAAESGLRVELDTAQPRVARGESVELRVGLHNPSAEAVAMPTVEVAVPPGFTPDRGSLETLVQDDQIARYEVLGTQINLYLESLEAQASVDLRYRLVAEARCTVTQRGAVAYAYYDPEVRGVSAPLTLSAQAPKQTMRAAR